MSSSSTISTSAVGASEEERVERKQRNLVLSGIGMLFARGIAAGGSLLLSVVASKTFSVAGFAEFSLCFVLLMMMSMLARFGVDASLLRFGGAAWHEHDLKLFSAYSRQTFRVVTLVAVLLLIVATIGLLIFGARWDAAPTFAWTLAAVLPWSYSMSISYIFKAARRPEVSTIFEPGAACLISAITVLIASRFGVVWTPASLTMMLSLVTIVMCIVGWVWLKNLGLINSEQTEIPHPKAFVTASANFMVIQLLQVVAFWGGSFLLEIRGDKTELAWYLAALRVATLTGFIANIVVLVVSPRLAGLFFASDSKEEFRQLSRNSSWVVFVAMSMPLLVLILGGEWVMGIFGPLYKDAAYLLCTIAIGQLVGSFSAMAPTLLAMTGHDRSLRVSTITSSFLTFGLLLALTFWLGAFGAAIATGLYAAIQNNLAARNVRRELGFWPIPSLSGFRISGRLKRPGAQL